MAISNMFTDPRDVYGGSDFYRAQEQEYRRQREAEYSRQQMLMQHPSYNPYVDQPKEKSTNTAPKPDLKDPLAFLKNTDKKVLLTGEIK